MRSDNSAPALNFTTFFASIVIISLVLGFTPVRLALSATENAPKPESATLSPFLNA